MSIEPTVAKPGPPDPPSLQAGPAAPYPVRRLYRDRDNKIVAGVAAGLAEHLRLPSVVVRIAFIAQSWSAMPERPSTMQVSIARFVS